MRRGSRARRRNICSPRPRSRSAAEALSRAILFAIAALGCGRAGAARDVAAPTLETREDASAETSEAIDVARDAPEDPIERRETAQAADLAACKLIRSDRVPLPEASGAALAGDAILLVADSGNRGKALLIDRANGQSVDLVLPLGEGAGDDVEGLESTPDGRIFGISSTGHLRAWRQKPGEASAFELVLGPSPLSDDPSWVCDPFGVNCAANFEGLCLDPAPQAGACAGWAASKARGELVCLVADGDSYRLDPARTIPVTEPERLSACAYEPEPPHRLLAGGNLFSASAIWEIAGDGPGFEIRELPERGAGNQEALLMLPGGELQSYGDAQDFLEGESPRTTLECR